jgi:hypothetical protein
MRKVSLIIVLVVLMISPGSLFAYEEEGGSETTVKELSGFVMDLASAYSRELEKSASVASPKFYPSFGNDLHTMEQDQAQVRSITQKALSSVLQQTVEQVDLFHTIKTYGEQMSFTQLRVSSNDVHVSGPSLKDFQKDSQDDSETDKLKQRSILSVRSGMSLTDSVHLAPMIQAHLGDMSSKVIYDPIAGGNWRVSLDRPITAHSTVEMVYLLKSADQQDLLATLRFGF